MMDTQDYALAQSFEELCSSGAFQYLMAYLKTEVEKAKGLAVLSPADRPTKEVRNLIIAWQEREKVAMALESLIEEFAAKKQDFEEELNLERAVERDRATRNWN